VKATAQIFLSYAREDAEEVEDLYQKLSAAGFKPWMDTKDLLPGERWKSSIQKAIRRSDFFLVCLSANSIDKRGWIQREIKQALDIWQEMLDSDIFLIPVRLEDCEVPESLCDFHWVDLFEANGWTQLVKAIQVGMERRTEVIKPIAQESTSTQNVNTIDLPAREWIAEKVIGPIAQESTPVRRLAPSGFTTLAIIVLAIAILFIIYLTCSIITGTDWTRFSLGSLF
jgi:hypothetical protein